MFLIIVGALILLAGLWQWRESKWLAIATLAIGAVVFLAGMAPAVDKSPSTPLPSPPTVAPPTPQPSMPPSKPPTPTAVPSPPVTPAAPPEPAPISLKGVGQTATSTFELANGVAKISMQHSGKNNFAVKLVDSTGRLIDLLSNTIGSFDGTRLVGVQTQGRYLFDVTADGPWTISITQPRPIGGQRTPVSLLGSGDSGLGPVELNSGLVRFNLSHDGRGNFAVWLLDSSGRRIDLLANEIGLVAGASKAGRIPRKGLYWLDVTADGPWSIGIFQ